MNNSRLLMIAGLTTILGMYTLGIRRAEVSLQSGAVAEAVRVQAKQIARAGIGMGLTRMMTLGVESTEVEALPMMGGTLSYTIATNPDSSSASVVSRGSYRGLVVQVSAWIDEPSPGRWVLRQEHWQVLEN